MINEIRLGRSVVMNYTLMHKNIKAADLSLDEETGSIVKIGKIYNLLTFLSVQLKMIYPLTEPCSINGGPIAQFLQADRV